LPEQRPGGAAALLGFVLAFAALAFMFWA